MRYFWFTNGDGENIMNDHYGNIRGARKKAETYLDMHPECESVYINEDEDIIDCIFR